MGLLKPTNITGGLTALWSRIWSRWFSTLVLALSLSLGVGLTSMLSGFSFQGCIKWAHIIRTRSDILNLLGHEAKNFSVGTKNLCQCGCLESHWRFNTEVLQQLLCIQLVSPEWNQICKLVSKATSLEALWQMKRCWNWNSFVLYCTRLLDCQGANSGHCSCTAVKLHEVKGRFNMFSFGGNLINKPRMDEACPLASSCFSISAISRKAFRVKTCIASFKRIICESKLSNYLNSTQKEIPTTWFPTHRGPYGFRSFSSTKMFFSLQRSVIVYHVDVKNRVLNISKTTSFFDISSCFFGMQHFFFLLRSSSLLWRPCKVLREIGEVSMVQKIFANSNPRQTFPIQGALLCWLHDTTVLESFCKYNLSGLSTICQRFASLPQWTGKKGGSSHLLGPFFVLMRHFAMFDFQTFGRWLPSTVSICKNNGARSCPLGFFFQEACSFDLRQTLSRRSATNHSYLICSFVKMSKMGEA